MSAKRRIIKRNLFLGFLLLCFFGGYKASQMLPIATGFAAKNMCSCVFIEARNPDHIQKNDLDFSFVQYTKSKIDQSTHSVTSTLFGLFKRTAKYDSLIGCTLDYPGPEMAGDDILCKPSNEESSINSLAREKVNEGRFLPKASAQDSVWFYIDEIKLIRAIDNAFDPEGVNGSKNTRTVLVIHRGKIIGEKYENGFDRTTPQLGWSMTKSFMNTWLGILVHKGILNIDDHPEIPEWSVDEREGITYRHLLQMNTGLEWEEMYGNATDITKMLYKEPDVFNYAVNKQIVHPVGEVWNYASGSTNILSGLMKQMKDLPSPYYCFLNDELFHPIGMESVLIEMDQSGTLVSSSYGFATPEDWARFGLLYLNDGVWNNNRILPEGWVDWTREVSNGSNGDYGAHFWLNAGHHLPDAPEDMFSANGFQGQRVFILPSQDLVIVRMGHSEGDNFDHNQLIKDVLISFK